jgi:SAM-dependent methyltransferase
MKRIPHSEEWYLWLSQKQKGYFYPGRKILSPWHGEDVFRTLVFEHLHPEMDVLEVACAQGDLALAMAPHVRSVLAYDATPAYIDLARQAAGDQGIHNVKFVVHNARAQFNNGQVRLPAEDHSIDLFVNSKGPFHTVLDASRVCRPGAVLLILIAGGGVPAGNQPLPWNDLLPESLKRPSPPPERDLNWAYKGMAQNLAEVGLHLHSWWDFDVPVFIPTPEDLYAEMTWPFEEDEVPAYQDAAPDLERIFREFAGPQGLELRWCRSICKAVVPAS